MALASGDLRGSGDALCLRTCSGNLSFVTLVIYYRSASSLDFSITAATLAHAVNEAASESGKAKGVARQVLLRLTSDDRENRETGRGTGKSVAVSLTGDWSAAAGSVSQALSCLPLQPRNM